MKIARGSLVLILCFLCNPALACKLLTLEPQQKFKRSSFVVLAYPIAISTSPNNALTPKFQGEFSQTIQWQVLVKWKGGFKPGDVITTMTKHETSNCGTGAQYKREAMLLFLEGKEPFTSPIVERPVQSIEELKYLDRMRRGG